MTGEVPVRCALHDRYDDCPDAWSGGKERTMEPRSILFVGYDDHTYEAAVTRVTDLGDEVGEVAVHVSETGRFEGGEGGGYNPGDVIVDVYYVVGAKRPVVNVHPVSAEQLQRRCALPEIDDDGEA